MLFLDAGGGPGQFKERLTRLRAVAHPAFKMARSEYPGHHGHKCHKSCSKGEEDDAIHKPPDVTSMGKLLAHTLAPGFVPARSAHLSYARLLVCRKYLHARVEV